MPDRNVSIERSGCISCGVCWSTCSDVFEQNQEDNQSQIVSNYRVGTNLGEGKIPESLGDCAKSAEELCPVQVIHVK